MQTLDQALFDLFESDQITYEDAPRNADSVNDLRLKISSRAKTRRTATAARGSSTRRS